MPRLAQKSSRRQQILESLAFMLEDGPAKQITTAELAAAVGVSEAALYRHFPSKSKMFEGLIDYVEEAIFDRIASINTEESKALLKLERILALLLGFAEKNPGLARILNGDALTGTGNLERPRDRIAHFYDKLDLQVKQILREAEINEGIRPCITAAAASNLLLSTVEGKISQFVRSQFARKPTQHWPEQWQQLISGFFREALAQPPQHSVSRQQAPLVAGGRGSA